MEYLIVAYDGKDPEAKDRRLAARQAHLAGVEAMIQAGSFIDGGAILNESGEMIGSTLYVEFESRQELDRWLKKDPYVTGGVWVEIDVKPIRLVFRERNQ
jgi:uncharacterized protein YciI